MKARIYTFAVSVIVSQIFGSFLTPIQASSPKKMELVEAVATRLEGVMDTSAQAAANPEKAHVRMTTCRIRLDRSNSDSIYLYQEQALADSLDEPYRQRFLEITPGDRDNEVISRTYKPATTNIWQGFCDRPIEQRIVSQEDVSQSVCSVYLKPLVSVYLGNTQPGGCPSNFRGATKVTNKIILHDGGMDTWDRGFNAAGEKVWGAADEGYQYRWTVN